MFRKLWSASVFRKTPEHATMSDWFAALFHRATASVYFIYALVAIAGLVVGIPTLVESQGQLWQILFSALVLVFISPACIGALFFPKTALMEMYSSAGFVSTMTIYLGILIYNVISGSGPGSWYGVLMVLSMMILPAFRAAMIYWLLIRQARVFS